MDSYGRGLLGLLPRHRREVHVDSIPSKDSSADPWLSRTLGSYRMVRKIAEGGMGAVYEAVHTKSAERAAIKVLLPELLSNADAANRFFNEAKAASLLSHPSLVAVYEHGKSPEGEPYIAMEYVDGDSLRERLEKRYLGGSVIGMVSQLAEALAVAHGKRIIHRDLKPENIMVVTDPAAPGGERSKILDFGIAKLLPDPTAKDDKRSIKTRTGTLIGTPTYMSPEQCRASAPPDEKTDVYSLGIILYELLYGEPPFVSESAGELFALQMFGTPAPLPERVPGIEPRLAALTHRLLDKKPESRPSMAELHEELQALQRSGGSKLHDGPVDARPSLQRSKAVANGAEADPATSGLVRAYLTGNTGQQSRGEQVARPLAGRKGKMAILLGGTGLALATLAALLVGRLHHPPPLPARTPPVEVAPVQNAAVPAAPEQKTASPGKPAAATIAATESAKVAAPSEPRAGKGKSGGRPKASRKAGHGPKDAKYPTADLWQ
jgi:serine/threonine-protein kinase